MEEITSVFETGVSPETNPSETETGEVTSETPEAETNTEPTTPDDGGAEVPPETEPSSGPEQMLTVKFNKQLRSLSREDATVYAQKGMKYDTISPLLDTLKYVATSEGKTLTEFVESIRKTHEDDLFSRLMERCGDEEIAKELLEVERGKHKAAFESLLEREKNEEVETEEAVTKRMSAEFDELRREFPQYSDFSKVPKVVVREAVEKGIPLLDAQLRYEHRERVKVENAKADQASAAKASVGVQKSAGTETASPVEAALMKGLWG